jgi:tRNA A-37 threonylcarbamoyl transferase component Bud32
VAFLIQRDLGDRNLRDEVAESGLSEARCREIARLFCQLRAAGLTHGDTKATNFLVADGTVHLIDLDALRLDATGTAADVKRFLENWDEPERERFVAAFHDAGLL